MRGVGAKVLQVGAAVVLGAGPLEQPQLLQLFDSLEMKLQMKVCFKFSPAILY